MSDAPPADFAVDEALAARLVAAQHPDAFAPPPFAIAHQILKSWAEEGGLGTRD